MAIKDISGESFGHWKAIERVGKDKWYNAVWKTKNEQTGEIRNFSLPVLKQIEKTGKIPTKKTRRTSVDLQNSVNYLLRTVPETHWNRFAKKCKKNGKPIIHRIRELLEMDVSDNLPEIIDNPKIKDNQKTADKPLIGLDPDIWFEFKDKCIINDKSLRQRLLELIWFDIVT